jgi:DNA-directed RNA polymerase subunit RPC12/RpoP
MLCIKCGNQLPEDAEFCNKCGTKIIFDNKETTPPNQNEIVTTDPYEILKKNMSQCPEIKTVSRGVHGPKGMLIKIKSNILKCQFFVNTANHSITNLSYPNTLLYWLLLVISYIPDFLLINYIIEEGIDYVPIGVSILSIAVNILGIIMLSTLLSYKKIYNEAQPIVSYIYDSLKSQYTLPPREKALPSRGQSIFVLLIWIAFAVLGFVSLMASL